MKIQKKMGGGRVGGSGWGQGGCERRIEAFEKIHKRKFGGGGPGRGGQSGCERRIEVFVKIPKKFGGGGRVWGGGESGRGIRVDVIEELKVLGKFTKKSGGREGGQVGGSGWWGSGWM